MAGAFEVARAPDEELPTPDRAVIAVAAAVEYRGDCFALLAVLSDYRSLERYRYLLGVASLGALALTIATSYATGTVVNGARDGVTTLLTALWEA